MDIQRHVQFKHPQTIKQAIAIATEFEAFVGHSDKVRKPSLEQEGRCMTITESNQIPDDNYIYIKQKLNEIIRVLN